MRAGRAAAVVLSASALVLGGLTPPAFAAGATAAFSGGTGVATAGGVVYAKAGAGLTLTVSGLSVGHCLELTGPVPNGFFVVTATSATFSATGATGDAVQTESIVDFAGHNATKCNGNQTPFSTSYTADNTAPSVTAVVTPAANAAGWRNSTTTVTWSATDAGSGVATGPTPATDTVTANGAGTVRTATATDRVGNAGTGSVTVNLDRAAPTITASRAPLANGFGWNNSTVTATFSCADALSGVASCPAGSAVSAETSGVTVSGTATDNAGNTASATTDTIRLDLTQPSLAGAPTTSANGAGWYAGDVTIHWTATDARSGVDPATAPGETVLTGEGAAVTASASVSDKAGNTRSTTSTPVKIDRTAPATSLTGVSNGWVNATVTGTLSASDNLSGVASTTYSLDGGPTQTGTTFTLSSEGEHTVSYQSTDVAGNVETTRTATVRIDRTAPTLTHAFVPSTHTDSDWTNAADLTVAWSCADQGGSGVATCPDPVTVSVEGVTSVSRTATDGAGNASASDTATLRLDRTPPTISATPDRSPNGNGWYDADVTVSFSCLDQPALSGIASCSAPVTRGEGGHQSATGSATDVAGNTASTTLTDLNIDKTAPDVTGALLGVPSVGWYRNDVGVHWTCVEPLSGLEAGCPSNSTITGEGANLGASVIVRDLAGNAGNGAVSGVRIDRTAPITTAGTSPAAPANGWFAAPPTVTLTGADLLSGLGSTWYSVDGGAPQSYSGPFAFSLPGAHLLTFWSQDVAGNLEDVTTSGHSLQVKLDGNPPSITGSRSPAANGLGWNNTDVHVSFSCADAETGITHCGPGATVAAEGQDQFVDGTAVDQADNTATARVEHISIDKTPPTLSGAATPSPNAAGWYRGDVTVAWTAEDGLSGVDSSTLPSPSVLDGEGDNLGTGPVSVQDQAGNSASSSYDGVKIDRTAPALTPSFASPNADGWYRAPVVVTWHCADVLSGIADGTCPDPSTVDGEGKTLGTSASVADVAGNATSSSVDGLQIDQTPPTTSATAPSGWVNHASTVTFTPQDGLSGVAATHFSVNGGSEQTGTEVTFGAEGTYDVQFWSVDRAGNSEAPQGLQVKIDRTAPVVEHGLSPAPNGAGWNKAAVTVTFTCADAGGSGIASCPEPVTESHDGASIEESGTAYDNAGNSTHHVTTVSIDTIPPVVSAAPDRAPNAAHWYRAPVVVSFSCDDLLSGVASCPGPVPVGEGPDQSVSGTGSDVAGNTATATLAHLNVDVTAPSLSGDVTTPPNPAGWYRSDVGVRWTCADALSGLAGTCPSDSVVDGEGAGLAATQTVEDNAGNSTTTSVGGINIDRTAPVTTATLPAATGDGWYAAPPTVTLAAVDTGSSVDGTFYALDGGAPQPYVAAFAEGLEGMHQLSYWSVDLAGNVEDSHVLSIGVDTTAPSIVGSRTAPDGAAGWAVSPVLVTFACSDAGAGIDTCAAPTLLQADGSGQSVTGMAVDQVGNSAHATVSDIDIDRTAPTLTPHYAAPNGAGWYRADVPLTWSCADATSGIPAGTCPAGQTVTGEGSAVPTSASVSDVAGNVTNSTVHLRIDRHPPVTAISPISDWTNGAVHLDLTPGEDLSGIAGTFFTVDGGGPQAGRVIDLTAEGVHPITWWSVDVAGNVEEAHHAQVAIDRSAPTITHDLAPEPNAHGWNSSLVTVSFTCDDALSGIASCTAPETVGSEGAPQTRTGHAVDNAGNTASDTASVNVDLTAPSITGSPARLPDLRGWYNQPVSVAFSCADGLSGISSCETAHTVGHGAGQVVVGSAADNAGNTAAATVSGLDVDLNAPTITGAATSAPNADGWYHGDVTVHFTCADDLSDVHSCPPDATLTGAGSALTVSGTAEDVAGNTASLTVGPIQIDRTAPTTTESHASSPYPSGWYAGPVAVTLTPGDDLSGVKVTRYRIDGGAETTYTAPVLMDRGVHELTWWSVDVADNAETPHSLTVRVDDRAPTISGAPDRAPNTAGWYAAPVTVAFSCADAETAVVSCGPTATVGEGAHQNVDGTAVDAGGNTAHATVGPLDVDLTPPVITSFAGSTAFVVGQAVVPPSCSQASDALSGLASCTVTVTGDPTRVGDTTYLLVASDRAGNRTTSSVTVHVQYAFSGWLQPVTNTAHDLGSASTFKAGSTVPLKFQLRDARGNLVNARTLPSVLAPVDLGLAASGPTSAGTVTTTTSGLSYTYNGDQYQFNWQTPRSGSGHYYRIGVRLDSGDVQTALIKLS